MTGRRVSVSTDSLPLSPTSASRGTGRVRKGGAAAEYLGDVYLDDIIQLVDCDTGQAKTLTHHTCAGWMHPAAIQLMGMHDASCSLRERRRRRRRRRGSRAAAAAMGEAEPHGVLDCLAFEFSFEKEDVKTELFMQRRLHARAISISDIRYY